MKSIQLDSETRRDFLKRFPSHLVNGFRSIASGGWVRSHIEGERGADGVGQEAGPKVARIDVARCHAWMGAMCQLCYLACPKRDKAIEMQDQLPVIIVAGCDGCAMCEVACGTVNDLSAIDMVQSSCNNDNVLRGKEVLR